MSFFSRTIVLIGSALLAADTFAQQPPPSWVEETMYRSGKINTVVAVVGVIIAGLAAWMYFMDRRISRMEKDLKK